MLTREPRIIPARAGFTRTTTRPAARQRDHPRSRGVYDSVFVWVVYRHGSSPLARGLHSNVLWNAPPAGTIPARAGFTSRTRSTRTGRSDHPRSRGVYLTPRWKSSGGGIIPARAGFTSGAPQALWPTRDHPRSRGVYKSYTIDPNGTVGSSPLARGLPYGVMVPPASAGIIPARAGFTGTAHASTARRPDHPRSRGVYISLPPSPMRMAGSSPLARGLLVLVAVLGRPLRIIPARAGFTPARPARWRACWDHPRSRGVY